MVIIDELDNPRTVAGNLRGRVVDDCGGERFACRKMENLR